MTGLIQIEGGAKADIRPPSVYRFNSSRGAHILAVDGSRFYDIPSEMTERLDELIAGGYFDSDAFGLHDRPTLPPVRSLSLNLSPACNLACGYCYADGGDFGQPLERMSIETAQRSVDFLLAAAGRGDTVLVGFMGGEPLTDRALLHATAHYAAESGARRGVNVEFAITTNGTLITPDDARLFSEYRWTVQFSMDGRRQFHDRQRPTRNGRSAYELILDGLQVLARTGRPRKLIAKASIAHGWDFLPEELDHLIQLGFDDVGFSPVLASRTPGWALDQFDLRRFLEEMILCGNAAADHWRRSSHYPFSNLSDALRHIHTGSHQPYPCGAAAAYLSTSASGDLYACHRFINDDRAYMGNVTDGLPERLRRDFLDARHVDRQQPCATCWARYLCGGSCHHEVLNRGRVACDYIRGWLHFCLQTYVELGEEFFA